MRQVNATERVIYVWVINNLSNLGIIDCVIIKSVNYWFVVQNYDGIRQILCYQQCRADMICRC